MRPGARWLADHEVAAVESRQRSAALGQPAQQLTPGDHVGAGRGHYPAPERDRVDLENVHDPRARRVPAILAGEDHGRCVIAGGYELFAQGDRGRLVGECSRAHQVAKRPALGIIGRALAHALDPGSVPRVWQRRRGPRVSDRVAVKPTSTVIASRARSEAALDSDVVIPARRPKRYASPAPSGARGAARRLPRERPLRGRRAGEGQDPARMAGP
jgi:hypothetical protein